MGSGIVAGGAVRAIANLAGIKNIISKIMGSQNQINNLKATIKALEELKAPENKFPQKIAIKETKQNLDKAKDKESIAKKSAKEVKNETTSNKNK